VRKLSLFAQLKGYIINNIFLSSQYQKGGEQTPQHQRRYQHVTPISG